VSAFIRLHYGCSLTPEKGYRFKVSENRMLKRILGSKKEEVQEAGENCIMRNFIYI
jgi:hypothetical protein